VNFLVNFVAYPITYKADTTLSTDEDIQISFIVDQYGRDYFGGNVDQNGDVLTGVSLSVSNVKFTGTGTFTTCDKSNVCQTITGNAVVPTGSTFKFIDGPNENGSGALTFDLTLTPNTGAPSITVHYVINVLPVNDPPVLVPQFYTVGDAGKGLYNECDEDTYIVINFTATDIDSPKSSLKGDVLQFLFQSALGKYYVCDGNGSNPNMTFGACKAGSVLKAAEFPAVFPETAGFSFVFVPLLDQNGINRLLLQVVDDFGAPSQTVVLEIRVLPINDRPWFINANATLSSGKNGTDVFTITSEVTDIRDYKFGRVVEVSYTVITAGADPADVGGTFIQPGKSTNGKDSPCVVSNDALSIKCTDKIEKVNSWLRTGIDMVPFDAVTEMRILLKIDDLGAIDKLNRSLDNNLTLLLNRTADGLIAQTTPPADNTAFIVAPIAGVLAGAIIAGIIFAIRNKKAKAAVESYFDKFALGVEGMTHASPLYVEAKKGAESPLYKSSNNGKS